MRSAEAAKNATLAAAAAGGAVLDESLGGWDSLTKLLVVLMAADYITGLLVAAIWHKSNKTESGRLDSEVSYKGLIRKCSILVMVWIGSLLDNAIGAHYVRTAIVLFFIGNEGLSLLENLGLMGVRYPRFIESALEALQDKGDKGNGKKEEDESHE